MWSWEWSYAQDPLCRFHFCSLSRSWGRQAVQTLPLDFWEKWELGSQARAYLLMTGS